jgi:UDP-2,3-diacylglucosamine hydrolase
MNSNLNDASARALFLADSHFHVKRGPAESRRLDLFLALLDRWAGIPEVVLLGDIFDFWFDYPHFAMKGYDPLLAALDQVRDRGSRIHFIGGNHDIWAARYLHERYGSDPAGGPLTLELDGQRVRCIHGDGLLGRDLLYQAFRSVVRHPAGVWLGKALHPEVLFAFSTWLSGHSRHSDRDEVAGIEVKARRWLSRQQNPPWDHLVMGHVHHAFTAEARGRRLTTLGGWLDPLFYGLWRGGTLEHHRGEETNAGEPALPVRP